MAEQSEVHMELKKVVNKIDEANEATGSLFAEHQGLYGEIVAIEVREEAEEDEIDEDSEEDKEDKETDRSKYEE